LESHFQDYLNKMREKSSKARSTTISWQQWNSDYGRHNNTINL